MWISTPFVNTKSYCCGGCQSRIDDWSTFNDSMVRRRAAACSLISRAVMAASGSKLRRARMFSPRLAPSSSTEPSDRVCARTLANRAIFEAISVAPSFRMVYSSPNWPAQKFSCSVLNRLLIGTYSASSRIMTIDDMFIQKSVQLLDDFVLLYIGKIRVQRKRQRFVRIGLRLRKQSVMKAKVLVIGLQVDGVVVHVD